MGKLPLRRRGFPAAIGRTVCAALTVLVLAAAALPAAERNASFAAALDSITARELKAHVEYLADDGLEGRLPGSRGGRAAGEYLAGQLSALRLRPGGVDGAYFQPFAEGYRNVLAVLPGSDPARRKEVVVLSAHYDHVGYGNAKNSRGPVGQVHNGADDNASGVSGVLELAGAFTILSDAPKRTILFAFWDAEEMGALGARHWLEHPTLPGHRVTAMMCMDMIGRLRGDRLTVFGTRTGYGLRRLISRQNGETGLLLDFDWSMTHNSDHFPFFEKQVPALLFHTGLHDDYHRPTDDADRIDAAGMDRVVRLVFGTAFELADAAQECCFRDESRRETPATLRAVLQRKPVLPSRLGVAWSEREFVGPGVRLTEVAPDSPAARAGLRAGDHLLRLGGREVRSGDELLGAVMTSPASLTVVAMRPGEENPLEVKVELAGEPMRIGILWRTDDAEPGTAVLTYVVPGSPAEQAGLQPGDRIYQVAGREFAGDEELGGLLGTLPWPLQLLIERDGRLRTATVRPEARPVKRAA